MEIVITSSIFSLTWISIIFLFMILGLLMIFKRNQLIDFLNHQIQQHFPNYAAIPTFEAAQLAGFHSNEFDLSHNLNQNDLRQLDLNEIRQIMSSHQCNFDQARLIRHNRYLARNGVDPLTGLPTDRKAITSLA